MSKTSFTAERLTQFKCSEGKSQAFLWDIKSPGLGVRTTPTGKPSYVFQSRYEGKTIRITIGKIEFWSIPEARAKARELQRQIDEGRDPRDIKAEHRRASAKEKAKAKMESITLEVLWSDYLRTKKAHWAQSTYTDHLKVVQPGGEPYKRWKGKKTKPGILAPLMPMKVRDIDSNLIKRLVTKESKARPTKLRLALRMFRAFLTWCSETKNLPLSSDIASTKEIRQIAGKPQAKKDHLLKEQLEVWFEHVQNIPNLIISSYLQCLLLTGARRNELLELKWKDINFQWSSITLHDKVDGNRQIPLTPYIKKLLSNLPRRNKWVFSSPTSQSGQITDPNKLHSAACKAAGLELSIHGLRRSFKSLSEWQELPIGVIAQIMGHKPSATAERHYTIRPLDLLRIHHEKFEEWILEQASVEVPEEKQTFSLIRSDRA